jgi:hypothetical protein
MNDYIMTITNYMYEMKWYYMTIVINIVIKDM